MNCLTKIRQEDFKKIEVKRSKKKVYILKVVKLCIEKKVGVVEGLLKRK